MPRTLPTGVQTAVSTSGYRACLAVEIGTAAAIRVTDNPAGVTIGGSEYPAGFLAVGETQFNDQPAVSIRIANTGNEITSPDLNGTAAGGVIGKTLIVYEVTYSAAGAQLTEDILYSGIVAGFVADSDSAEIVGTLAELCVAGMTGLVTSRLCPYVYGGTRCGDTDATSCDHTFTGCTAHANTARFGGFRTMPTLNTKLSYYLTEWVPGTSRFGTSVTPTTPVPPPRPDIRPPRLRLSPAGPRVGGTPSVLPPPETPGETY